MRQVNIEFVLDFLKKCSNLPLTHLSSYLNHTYERLRGGHLKTLT